MIIDRGKANRGKHRSDKIKKKISKEGFLIDGYIPELNLCIEVDEIGHIKEKKKEKDIERQKIIEDKLGCKFLRIKDY